LVEARLGVPVGEGRVALVTCDPIRSALAAASGGEFTMPSRREVWGFAVELAIAVAILAVASVVFAGVWNALKWLVGW
jgi:hypothetical protein